MFTDRLRRLTRDIDDTTLAVTLGISAYQVRHLRSGHTATLKLEPALRLCKKLGIDPFYLAFGEGAVPLGVTPKADPQVATLAAQLAKTQARVDAQTGQLRAIAQGLKKVLESSSVAQKRRSRKRPRGK